MTATFFSKSSRPTDEPLLGPDLRSLPSLADQLHHLDTVKRTGDSEAYAAAWLATSDANGGYPTLLWDNDGSADAAPAIMTGVHCDWQEDARRLRWTALNEHHGDVPGFRTSVEKLLLAKRRFSDNRRTSPLELKSVLRAYFAAGGRLLIYPDGKMSMGCDASILKVDTPDWQVVAAYGMVRLLRRWRVAARLKGLVARLGAEDSGFIVLEARR